jgi:hypothetical protein
MALVDGWVCLKWSFGRENNGRVELYFLKRISQAKTMFTVLHASWT